MQTNQSSASSNYLLRPSICYFWHRLITLPLTYILLIGTTTPAVVMAYKQRYLLMSASLLVATLVYAAFLYLNYLTYKRIRYLFSKEGFVVERGLLLNEHQWTHWNRVSSVELRKSISEQMTDCATIRVGIDHDQYIDLVYLANYTEIFTFFKQHVTTNLSTARRINAI